MTGRRHRASSPSCRVQWHRGARRGPAPAAHRWRRRPRGLRCRRARDRARPERRGHRPRGVPDVALDADRGQIEVDGHFRTSADHVYAVGDVVAKLQLTPGRDRERTLRRRRDPRRDVRHDARGARADRGLLDARVRGGRADRAGGEGARHRARDPPRGLPSARTTCWRAEARERHHQARRREAHRAAARLPFVRPARGRARTQLAALPVSCAAHRARPAPHDGAAPDARRGDRGTGPTGGIARGRNGTEVQEKATPPLTLGASTTTSSGGRARFALSEARRRTRRDPSSVSPTQRSRCDRRSGTRRRTGDRAGHGDGGSDNEPASRISHARCSTNRSRLSVRSCAMAMSQS